MNRAWGQAGLSPVSRAFSCLNTLFLIFIYLFNFKLYFMYECFACMSAYHM